MFLRVLAAAPDNPRGLLELIGDLALSPDTGKVEQFADMLRAFRAWQVDSIGWGAQFLLDSELNWLHAAPPIDDL